MSSVETKRAIPVSRIHFLTGDNYVTSWRKRKRDFYGKPKIIAGRLCFDVTAIERAEGRPFTEQNIQDALSRPPERNKRQRIAERNKQSPFKRPIDPGVIAGIEDAVNRAWLDLLQGNRPRTVAALLENLPGMIGGPLRRPVDFNAARDLFTRADVKHIVDQELERQRRSFQLYLRDPAARAASPNGLPATKL